MFNGGEGWSRAIKSSQEGSMEVTGGQWCLLILIIEVSYLNKVNDVFK